MNFTKTKTFKINNSELVKIAECCETNYGYYIWPSSIILANFLLENRSTVFNSSSSNLLELGTGTSLSSIIARKYCSLNKVIITDDLIANRDLTSLITESLKLNSISQSDVSIKHLKWADFNKADYSNLPKIDFLIGSDVFFDPKYLIATVRLLMDFNNPNLLFFTTYEMRSFNGYLKLLYLLEKYNLKFKQIERMPKEHLVEVQEGNNKTIHDSDQHEIILFQINK